MGCMSPPPSDRSLVLTGACSQQTRGLQAARKLRTTRRENRWVRPGLLYLSLKY
jgi:hypothetical protein